ncbi:trypsin-like peptidase domain-containing protein [Niastella yeongjuensis]|nr:trypsin-like peptidase domain-containing protein [Niastella yeongjuensis]SEO14347.1 Trypsin-like peptidase domain-containing protein [Niastella yeongjuensis]
MALLTPQQARELAQAIIDSGIDTVKLRPIFMMYIKASYVATLRVDLPPAAQVKSDIAIMDMTEQLTNGDVPLLIYLENIIPEMEAAPTQQTIVKKIRDSLVHLVNGAPRVNVAAIPERQELIVNTDDTLPILFMEMGVKIARSVSKLKVQAFENGQPKMLGTGMPQVGNGTGWLLTESILVTNHHVINARREGEPDASDADLQLQGNNLVAIFDFDDATVEGTPVTGTSLLGSNKALDYALIRITATGRPGLKPAKERLSSANPVAVNIIQHPGGKAKRVGIRNNLVSASTDVDLRYFTDTDGGSSGSPVLNDSWEVVALHRGATFVENVNFQGKPVAYVNVGTQWEAIKKDIEVKFPAIFQELRF